MNVDVVRNWPFPVIRQRYAEKDTILYALALGYGSDPVSPAQLRYVYEKRLVALPTQATTLCHPGLWIADPLTGVDFKRVVNGEQRMTMHAPLPARGNVRGEARVLEIIDKGKDKGAQVLWERTLYDDNTGALLATIEQVTFCRGDGGFDGASQSSRPAGRSGAAPDRAPDRTIDLQTLPQAALIYRLSADLNPLHADPDTARSAGFERPILHGLATYGMVARAIVQLCCDDDPARLRHLGARFSAPVFPGDVIRTEVWEEPHRALIYRCTVPARNAIVITNGTAEVRAVEASP